jgi:hypothetical protein
MTIQQIESRLQIVGASASEASDLAPILYLNGWHDIPAVKPSEKVLSDLSVWLTDWRSERRGTAQCVRSDRQKARDAGYRSVPQESPVYVGCGETAW